MEGGGGQRAFHYFFSNTYFSLSPPPHPNPTSRAGRDATEAFWRLHAPEVMAEHGHALRIGTVEGGPLATANPTASSSAMSTTVMVETVYDFVIVGASEKNAHRSTCLPNAHSRSRMEGSHSPSEGQDDIGVTKQPIKVLSRQFPLLHF